MNNRNRQLMKNTAIVAVGQICTKFITFLLLPLYTSILTTEEYGIVDLLNTCISLVIPIFFLQINQGLFRFLIDVRNNEISQKRIISTCFIFILVQSLIYIIICMFINNDYKYFLASNVVLCVISDMLLQISRGLGDNKTYSEGSLISGVSAVVFNVLFIAVFKLGVFGMLTATLISYVLCIIFIIFKKKIYYNLKIRYISMKNLKELLHYSVPLVPNQISWWIINASDRFIITYVLGIAANGIYSAANKFSSICVTLFGIFNMTWAESASLHIVDNDSSDFFSDVINNTIRLFSCICIGIIALMPFIFKFLIIGKDYSTAFFQIPILMLATLFNILVSLFGSIYIALKKSKAIAKTSIYSAILNILINILLIGHIGLYAASISTFMSYFLMTIYRFIDIRKYIKVKIDKKFIHTFIPLGIIVLIIYYLQNRILSLLSLLIVFIFSIITNKKIIIYFIQIIKNRLAHITRKEMY